ncbi:MAG: phenylacetate-CoA oxygenase, PaaI subunit [Frankiales bacterium]|nr:phenylacetate-CoA oxygenase, PaaI subunit [Frankiales bacterium]
MTAVQTDTDTAVYALRLGDDALVLAQRLCEWAARAPQLEEDVALLNLALDLLGQARSLLTRAGELAGPDPNGTVRTEDDLAYLRDEPEFCNALLMEVQSGDFGRTMARQLLVSAWQVPLWTALAASADEGIAGVAGKAVKEAAYHLDHARSWVLRLGDGTAESHRRLQQGLDDVWPYAAELFERDALLDRLVERGVAADPALLEPQWRATVQAVLAEATLTVPETTWRPTGGRRGQHLTGFGYLLAELQHLHRSHPGATW